MSALLLLFRGVLGRELAWMDDIVSARRPAHLPVVLGRTEGAVLLRELQRTGLLMASLLYGSGLRLLECCRLRVKDLEFARGEMLIR